MPIQPTLSQNFFSYDDWRLKTFLTELTERKRVNAFRSRIKAAANSPHKMQTTQHRHYLEHFIIDIMGEPEGKYISKYPDADLSFDGKYEALEFLTTLYQVYNQAPVDRKFYIKQHFNSMFDNPQGMIPLAHELTVARILSSEDISIDFREYGGNDRFDILARKDEVEIQVECKSCAGDNGKYFKISQTDNIFEELKKIFISNKSIFHNKILCIYPKIRSIKINNIPFSTKKSVEKILHGDDVTEYNGICAELVPFDDDVVERAKQIPPNSENSGTALAELLMGDVRRHSSTSNLHLEWNFTVIDRRGEDFRFSLVFCSDRQTDWTKQTKSVLLQAAKEQLANCSTPVVFVRYTDMLNHEIDLQVSSSGDPERNIVNLLDKVFVEAAYESDHNLCAAFFIYRPRFRNSSLLHRSGNNLVSGKHLMRSVFNKKHPQAATVRHLLRNIHLGESG